MEDSAKLKQKFKEESELRIKKYLVHTTSDHMKEIDNNNDSYLEESFTSE